MQHKLKIFCDFDGTITTSDVWMEVGKYFIKDKVKWNTVISRFERQEIGARECFITECSMIENFDIKKFEDIIYSIPLDPKFLDFYDFCRSSDIPFTILSEGMDFYIERILKKNGLVIPYFSNKYIHDESVNMVGLEFPNADSECLKCGCCKRNLLMNMSGDDEISVYIGDGFSDACVSKYADVVFAKKSLASYCWKNNITYFEYSDFGDIKKKLEKLLQKKIIKPRMNARVNRKNVFIQG